LVSRYIPDLNGDAASGNPRLFLALQDPGGGIEAVVGEKICGG